MPVFSPGLGGEFKPIGRESGVGVNSSSALPYARGAWASAPWAAGAPASRPAIGAAGDGFPGVVVGDLGSGVVGPALGLGGLSASRG